MPTFTFSSHLFISLFIFDSGSICPAYNCGGTEINDGSLDIMEGTEHGLNGHTADPKLIHAYETRRPTLVMQCELLS